MRTFACGMAITILCLANAAGSFLLAFCYGEWLGVVAAVVGTGFLIRYYK